MNGDLIQIIYGFYISLFNVSTSDSKVVVFNDALNGVWRSFITSLENNTSLFTEFYHLSSLYGSSNSYYVFISLILTIITFVVLIVLLFKLFKWIFNLIFKLMRLN